MEIEIGDLLIATRLPEEINSFVNGDIIQITDKFNSKDYFVKVIYKADDSVWNGANNWRLYDECQYFDKL